MIDKSKFKEIDDEKLQKATGGAYAYDDNLPSNYHCDFYPSWSACEHCFDWYWDDTKVWDCNLGYRPVNIRTHNPASIYDTWNY